MTYEFELTERELSALVNGDDFTDQDWLAMER